MSPAAPLAFLEQRVHEESSLTTVPTVHDSAGDPVVAYLARLTSAKSRSPLRGALALVAVEFGWNRYSLQPAVRIHAASLDRASPASFAGSR